MKRAYIGLIRHRGKPHSPQMILCPVAQHALAGDMADHAHGDRGSLRAQPAHRHADEAHAPHVAVRFFILCHALQQRVVSRFAAHAASYAHAQSFSQTAVHTAAPSSSKKAIMYSNSNSNSN
jgi:hypothetical protein